MSYTSTPASKPAFSPLDLQNAPLALRSLAVVLGTGILAAASYVSVPMIPVPITMQTLAVTLIGALYGWRLGAATVVAWPKRQWACRFWLAELEVFNLSQGQRPVISSPSPSLPQ